RSARWLLSLVSRQNRRLLGVYDFSGGQQRYLAMLQSWLEAAGERDLLMCHPSRTSDPEDSLSHSRQAEYEVLVSAEFAEWVAARGIVLSPISRMLAASGSSDS
ncbi:MAG: ChbG/HpnK family deacetylase, partial [Burkholderiales bacterium]